MYLSRAFIKKLHSQAKISLVNHAVSKAIISSTNMNRKCKFGAKS